jgi:predicted nuclease of predicted toxin-antitoxin system
VAAEQAVLPALLADENVPAGTVVALRALGFDVLAIGEAHRAVSDRAVLALARESGRWLITFDRDYGELIFKHGEPPPVGILFLRQRPNPAPAFADWVCSALESEAQRGRLRGHLAVLDGRGVRLRQFPQARAKDG